MRKCSKPDLSSSTLYPLTYCAPPTLNTPWLAADSSYAVLDLVRRLFPAKMEFVAALVQIGVRLGVRGALPQLGRPKLIANRGTPELANASSH